jgi:hypothetical protein
VARSSGPSESLRARSGSIARREAVAASRATLSMASSTQARHAPGCSPVSGATHERDTLGLCSTRQPIECNGCGGHVELALVSYSELIPTGRLVAEPPVQRRGRHEIPCPLDRHLQMTIIRRGGTRVSVPTNPRHRPVPNRPAHERSSLPAELEARERPRALRRAS